MRAAFHMKKACAKAHSLITIQPIRVKISYKKMLFYAGNYTRISYIARVVSLMFMRFLDHRTNFSIPMLSLA